MIHVTSGVPLRREVVTMTAQSVLAYDEFDTRRSPVPKTLRSWA